MSMDLSFWEPPNWKKESRIHPMFWVFLTVFVVICLSVGGIIYLGNKQTHLKEELASIENLTNRMSASYNMVLSKKAVYKVGNTRILADLRERCKRRPNLAAGMAKLFSLVSDDIIFKTVSINGTPVLGDEKEKKPKKPQLLCRMKYQLSIQGTIYGANPEERLDEFSRLLEDPVKGFGKQIVDPEVVDSVSSNSAEFGTLQTEFVIEAMFRER